MANIRSGSVNSNKRDIQMISFIIRSNVSNLYRGVFTNHICAEWGEKGGEEVKKKVEEVKKKERGEEVKE